MWMKKGEKFDPQFHTFNRYGVQLGEKVPLWGGFTGTGHFPLKIWSPRAKMSREEWIKMLPILRRSVYKAGAPILKRPIVWQDNETFLQAPVAYNRVGLRIMNFPPNSGDLNPIETVWARLRRDLSVLEFQDLKAGIVLPVAQYRQRAARILNSYGRKLLGQKHSYLQKLVMGMPARLRRCKANRYGPFGK